MSVDLSTEYLGLDLRSPLVASCGPLTGDVESLKRLADAGAAAVVLPSLFEEQIEHEATQLDRLSEFQSDTFAEGLTYFPEFENYGSSPHEHVELIGSAKAALDVPVIASLNGTRLSGWTHYAQKFEEAGADAIELNVYRIVTDPDLSAAQVEDEYVQLLSAVCDAVSIPVAIKLAPQFSALPHFARRLEAAGARGLVLFNRFLYPDIDLEELVVNPHLTLSTSNESLQVVRWIAILRDLMGISLAATSGVHVAEDAIKLLLVGADVTMMTSALLKQGHEHIRSVADGLAAWLEVHGYESIRQMKGSMSAKNAADPAGFERANYMQALISYSSEPT